MVSAQTVDAELARLSVSARRYPPQAPDLAGRSATMVLNAAYLVVDERADEFVAAVSELAARQPGRSAHADGAVACLFLRGPGRRSRGPAMSAGQDGAFMGQPDLPDAAGNGYGPAIRGERIALVDLLDRVLAGGVVIAGDVTLSIANVDLVTVNLRALITSVSSLAEPRSAGAGRNR